MAVGVSTFETKISKRAVEENKIEQIPLYV
jgi:hypothetical protein